MAQHFSVHQMELVETGFRVGVFPKLAAVMEEDTGDHEVAVEMRIDIADD